MKAVGQMHPTLLDARVCCSLDITAYVAAYRSPVTCVQQNVMGEIQTNWEALQKDQINHRKLQMWFLHFGNSR